MLIAKFAPSRLGISRTLILPFHPLQASNLSAISTTKNISFQKKQFSSLKDYSSMEGAIKLLDAYTEAFNSHDAAKVSKLVLEDWTFVNVWGVLFAGREPAIESFDVLFKSAFAKAHMRRGSTNLRMISDTTAVAVVEYDIDEIWVKGEKLDSKLIATHTLTKRTATGEASMFFISYPIFSFMCSYACTYVCEFVLSVLVSR